MARPRKEVDTSTYAGRFAVQIKSIREKRKLTIEDVAEKSSIPASTIYCWEEGKNMPSVERILQLSKVFNASVHQMIPNN